jgi:hypothetical protein
MARPKDNSKYAGIKKYSYTFSLRDDMNDIEDIKDTICQYNMWAYVKHDQDSYTVKDVVEGAKIGDFKPSHHHFFIKFKNKRSLIQIAKDIGIEPNQLQIVRNQKAILQYFIHSNNPEKHAYSEEDVIANFDYSSEADILPVRDIIQEYRDYSAVMEGRMHPEEYLKKYSIDFTTFKKWPEDD